MTLRLHDTAAREVRTFTPVTPGRASLYLCGATVQAPPHIGHAFDRYYLETHMPLVAKIPGLQRAETARFDAALDGSEKTYYRTAELYFADQPAVQAAFASEEGQATAADYQQIAPPGSRMFMATLDE
jgi:uncharacterized protein (TIGR02118 family)